MSRRLPRFDAETVRQRLLTQREMLQADSATAAVTRVTVDLDQAGRGSPARMEALQLQAMAQAEETRRKVALRRITTALERLEAGEYGYCVACEEPISAGRLEADPAVPTCIGCASRQG
ncbi:MAG: TraR/DksA C4-type zinc finger protein [Magnetococcales bacterium]|nr:TraR/DksA C4-type zinc finger protein [Magnetococcales bacterium]